MKKLFVVVLAGCGVSNAHDGDPSQSPGSTNADTSANGATHAPCHRYDIEGIPTPVSGGFTSAARAICSGGVVGTADITAPDQSHAVLYEAGQLTDLGTLGGSLSRAQDGNAQGTIVGGSTKVPFTGAFVYRDGVMTELPGIGGEDARAWAINNREEIAGVANIPPNGDGGDTDNHAILWEPGDTQPIDLTALNGGRYSWTRDINDQGDIVGTDIVFDPDHQRAVVWRDRVLVVLDDGGALESGANAVNEAGTIVGFIDTPQSHAVIWQNDTMIDLSAVTGLSVALGIDNSGHVVGSATSAVGSPLAFAFLYSEGSMLDLNDSIDQTGWSLREATDVCDDGRIVGNGELDGIARGFVLTPAH